MKSLSSNNSIPFKENNLLSFKVTRAQVYERWRNYIDPDLIKACLTRYEIEIIMTGQEQLRPDSFAFFARVLQRSPDFLKRAWRSIEQILSKAVKNLTGRDNLKVFINGVEKYYFGPKEIFDRLLEIVWKAYQKRRVYQANNDNRTFTRETLPMERLLALARAQNDKDAQAEVERKKRKARKAKKAEKDSKRAKKVDAVLSVLKSDEEVKKLEEQQPNADWVKAKNEAYNAFLRAGHSEESIRKFLDVARSEIEAKPLGRSRSDMMRDRNAKKKEENRKVFADITNNL